MQPDSGERELSRVSVWEVLAQTWLFDDACDRGEIPRIAGKPPVTRWFDHESAEEMDRSPG